MPRGLPLGSVSAIFGIPVDDEKRTVIGVNGALKCGAELSFEDLADGVKVPIRRCPFACAVLGFVRKCLCTGWEMFGAECGCGLCKGTDLGGSLDEDQLRCAGCLLGLCWSRRLGCLLKEALLQSVSNSLYHEVNKKLDVHVSTVHPCGYILILSMFVQHLFCPFQIL
jgi:hypothetical protein